jgi:hypothetical protein
MINNDESRNTHSKNEISISNINNQNNTNIINNQNHIPEIANIKLKSKKRKEKKINNYIENLKNEGNKINVLNIDNMNGKELTSLMKENRNIYKTNIDLVNLLLTEEQANNFFQKYEGLSQYQQNYSKTENNNNNINGNNIQKENQVSKKPIREYVDQILDKEFEKIFSNFICKLRDIYYKKKSVAPLKAKKRIVVGMREIEKNLKLNNVLLLFVVPYIEKVVDVKNSLDERLMRIFDDCHKKEIPIFFGLNKFKLGQISRKKLSSISMLGIVNVEGMENELKNIIKKGEELKKKWYLENYNKKESYIENKFIKYDLFDYYHNTGFEIEEKNKNNNY